MSKTTKKSKKNKEPKRTPEEAKKVGKELRRKLRQEKALVECAVQDCSNQTIADSSTATVRCIVCDAKDKKTPQPRSAFAKATRDNSE